MVLLLHAACTKSAQLSLPRPSTECPGFSLLSPPEHAFPMSAICAVQVRVLLPQEAGAKHDDWGNRALFSPQTPAPPRLRSRSCFRRAGACARRISRVGRRDLIAEASIPCLPLRSHARQHRHAGTDIVVDDDLALGVMLAAGGRHTGQGCRARRSASSGIGCQARHRRSPRRDAGRSPAPGAPRCPGA